MCCSIENSSAAEAVLRAVEATLQKSPFSYQGSRTLSGQEEGAFGWVTVNYLDERLKQVSTSCRGLEDSPAPLLTVCLLQGLETMGALDLGGASTQISFVPDGFVGSESPNNSMMFRLYGNDYNLYTHSFLCYGKDQALRLTLAQQTQVDSLIQEPLPGPPLLNPPSVLPGRSTNHPGPVLSPRLRSLAGLLESLRQPVCGGPCAPRRPR